MGLFDFFKKKEDYSEFELLFQKVEKNINASTVNKLIDFEIRNLTDTQKTELLITLFDLYQKREEPLGTWNDKEFTYFKLITYLVKDRSIFEQNATLLLNQVLLITEFIIKNFYEVGFDFQYLFKPLLSSIIKFQKLKGQEEIDL
ncbi:MAG: hypothetical protein R2774_09850 [Saprospiraceae bacterium]